MDLKDRAIQGVVGFGSISVIRYVVSFGSQILFARLLSPEAFGIVTLAAAFVTLVGLLGRWGIGEAIMQQAKYKNTFSTIFWCRFGFSVLTIVVVFAASPILGPFYDRVVVDALLVFAVSKSIAGSATPFHGAMTRDFRLTYLATGQLISLIVSVVVGLWLVVYGGFGVWGLVIFYALQDGLNAVMTTYLSPQYPKLAFNTNAAHWFLGFAKGMWISKATDAAENQLDDFLIGTIGATAVLGFYNIAWKITNSYTTIFQTAITKGILPTFSRLKGETEEGKYGMEFVLRLQSYVVVPLYLFISITATDIVVLIFGKEWAGAGPILSILALAGILYPLVNTIRQYYYSIGRSRIVSKVNGLMIVLMLLSIPPLLLLFGGEGAALSMIIVEAAAFLTYYRSLRADLDVSFKLTLYPSAVGGMVTVIASLPVVMFDLTALIGGSPTTAAYRILSIVLTGTVVFTVFFVCLYFAGRSRLREDLDVVGRSFGIVD